MNRAVLIPVLVIAFSYHEVRFAEYCFHDHCQLDHTHAENAPQIPPVPLEVSVGGDLNHWRDAVQISLQPATQKSEEINEQ